MIKRKLILILSLFTLFSLAFSPAALALERCSLCGMDVDKSETAYYVKLESGRVYPLCSLHCVHMLLMNLKQKKEKPVSIRAEDYPTGRLIEAREAHFLCESRLVPEGSMRPYILTFASRGEAERFMQEYGGRVLDFEGAMGIVKKAMMKGKEDGGGHGHK